MLDRVTGMQVFVHQHMPLSLAAALAAPRKFPDAKPLRAQRTHSGRCRSLTITPRAAWRRLGRLPTTSMGRL